MGFKNKKPTFAAIELTGENVETIYRRCLTAPDTDELDKEKVEKNATQIRYLFGQLRLIHQGCYEFDFGADLALHYSGAVWSEDGKHVQQMTMLLKLGVYPDYNHVKETDGKLHNWVNHEAVWPTLSPRDPAFAGWWDVHGPYYQAKNLIWLGFNKTPEEKQTIVDYYRRGTEKGDPWAQEALASAYLYGMYNLPKDPAEAFRLYSLSAEAGIPDSCSELAHCYAYGEGTGQDYEAAIQWYCRAIEGGGFSARAASLGAVGSALLLKWGEEKNRDLRRQYYKLAKEAFEKAIKALQVFADEPKLDFSPVLRVEENLQNFKKLLLHLEEHRI